MDDLVTKQSAAAKAIPAETPETYEPAAIPDRPFPVPVIVFLIVVAILAFIDRYLMLNTLMLECIHSLVVTSILLSCLVFERRHPHIRQFGWPSIVWGIGLIMFGTYVDILDDAPLTTGVFGRAQFPFGPSWEKAVLKTTVGYTLGIGLFAYGFFQWIPWLMRTRLEMQKLNKRLSLTNRNLNRAMMSMDEHIESNRVAISRELHDDVAQQLTFVNVQIQLCRKEMALIGTDLASTEAEPANSLTERLEQTGQKLEQVAGSVSEALRSVRQISGDLRPESLFSLGLIPALEQFFEKLHNQYPATDVFLSFEPLVDGATHTHLEKNATDAELLHLFRIIQEGVRNAIKHGNPTQIDVFLQEKSREEDNSQPRFTTSRLAGGGHIAPRPVQLRICIEDNGPGLPWPVIPPDDLLIQEGHLGIVGLKERTRELGGIFMLSSRESQSGACLEINLI